ncbi:peptidoglycan endopeptidase [Edwardsiella ictaluri]|uniref:NlpC/P60 family protein n=1 Tax=Edwardsiella ictaluri (strain 93-146) TaxID=634503 RepID=C5BE43_EDWI9|nr:C40 family peptidase [Edwardsiella ictaluri]ACR69284.1 NlpC/P60 family protein [Edwardsiella ictaluri 93-146]AVZ83665.1 peptidoglycan endopeptidase [Edwardsiella ictaluri]EKS7763916.1 C40 family peptidase [Edwardsiella ictaluri]EKS7770698.1 C40 family peptidase [Edwardsiella ictaluri]EKS7773840.1 C40 family peptidase [Edwardsiella ictaluri]
MRLFVALFVLLFTQWFTTSAAASPAHKVIADQRKATVAHSQSDERKKRRADDGAQKRRSATPHPSSRAKRAAHTTHRTVTVPHRAAAEQRTKAHHRSEKSLKHRASVQRAVHQGKKAYGRPSAIKSAHRSGSRHEDGQPIHMNPRHKKRYQHAKQTAMNKLMRQIGKPYHWGGTSPHTGFDCSGLIYYAYQDLLNIKIPRTANEMYHLRDAAPVKRAELQRGDLVFFQIHGHGAADHVGVYLGNGKFIQSPRTGEEIRVSYLGDNYWQDHYLGARRVMTPKTIR